MTDRLSRPTLRRLLRARDLIHDRGRPPPSVEELARAAGLSRAHFHRCFRRAFGATPLEVVTATRLDAARRALARGESVTEACLAAGYTSLGSFSTLFARRYGAPPREWQRRTRLVLPAPGLWTAAWVPGCFLLAYGSSTIREAPSGAIR